MDHGAANPRLKQLEGLTRLKALCDAGVVSLGTFARAKASVLTAAFAGETDAADDAPLLALVDEAPAFADALRAGALTAAECASEVDRLLPPTTPDWRRPPCPPFPLSFPSPACPVV